MKVQDGGDERIAGGVSLPQTHQRFRSRRRAHRPHAPVCELMLKNPAIGFVVVDDEDAGSRQRGGWRARRFRDASLPREAGSEPESRSARAVADEANLAAHQLHEMTGDRQAKARAAEFPRRRLIGLRKALEQPRLDIGWDADPGVDDFRADHYAVVAHVGERHVDDDLAVRREFHRIADQVVEDLSESPWISTQPRGHFRRNRGDELDPGIGADRNGFGW